MRSRDTDTLDLLDWQPPSPVVRFSEKTVRAASLRDRIAKAVSATLTESSLSRAEISKSMSRWLGECVTKNMLDAYSSESRTDHNIPFIRIIALAVATQDARILQLAGDQMGHSIVPDHYLTWIEVGQLADKQEELKRRLAIARNVARKGGAL
ncbi:MAG: DNA transposition protein [Rhodospirillaceae bacterium]|nr:MAG: DNA transposition protein [Rhodospirillaceae bacterium]